MTPHTHDIDIIINAQPFTVQGPDIDYETVVGLAFPELAGQSDALFTVAYWRGESEHSPSGTLTSGQRIRLKPRMVFDVVATTKS